MNTLPPEAREGLIRAWLKVLSDRHPEVTWVPVSDQPVANGIDRRSGSDDVGALATAA